MGCSPSINPKLRRGVALDSTQIEVVDDLRKRPASVRRNLARMRETSLDTIPLIFPEGEDDEPLIEKAFGGEVDIRLVSGGKPACLKLAEWLKEDGSCRARVIVDRDFDDVTGVEKVCNPLLIVSETHDVLMDILASAPRVVSAAIKGANKSRYRGLRPVAKDSQVNLIHERALDAAFNLSSVRIWAARNGVGLKFDTFSFVNYFQEGEITVDAAVRNVLRKTEAVPEMVPDPEAGTLLIGNDSFDVSSGALEVCKELQEQRSSLVGDHDFLKALSYLLDEDWGKKKLRTLLESEAERHEIEGSPWGARVREFLDSLQLERTDSSNPL